MTALNKVVLIYHQDNNVEKVLEIEKEIRGFFDKDGMLKSWPSKLKKQELVLAWVVENFEKRREYSATEIKDVLNQCHTFGDPVLLRRELIDKKHLHRTQDGKTYWREAPK